MAKHPDILDRQTYGPLMTLYMLPGRIWLWLRYITAAKGKVFKTARRARSPIYTFFVSTIIWSLLGFCTYSIYVNQPPQVQTE
jgi:hypothetical protein